MTHTQIHTQADEIERERETDRERQTERERETERKRDRETGNESQKDLDDHRILANNVCCRVCVRDPESLCDTRWLAVVLIGKD